METLWWLLDNSQCWWRQGLVRTWKQTISLSLTHTHAHIHTHTHTPMYINAWKHLSLSGSMSMRSDTHTQSHNNFRSKTNTNISLYSLLTNLVFGSEGFASMCKKKKKKYSKKYWNQYWYLVPSVLSVWVDVRSSKKAETSHIFQQTRVESGKFE